MFKNRVRLPIYTRTAQFPTEANRFRLANGVKKTLSVVIRKTYELVTDYMNESMHQRLVIALNHDEVAIEGDKYIGNLTLDNAYEIEWPDFLDYPLGQGKTIIEVTPFDATNSNCESCNVLVQLELVDDTIGEIEAAASATVNVYANDEVCCFPIVAEIVSFNTTYLESCTIDEATGVVTMLAKEDAPTVGNIVLATYRVTCPDGSYDEADIYGSIAGAGAECEQPSGFDIVVFTLPPAPFDATIEWSDPNPAPAGGYEWQLFRCDTPGTMIASGTTGTNATNVTGLEPATDYCFYVRSVCGEGVYSVFSSLTFQTPASEDENCGNFSVAVDDGTLSTFSYLYSYMNCNGEIISGRAMNLQTYNFCMLMDEYNQPVYFESIYPYFTITYVEPC